VNSLILQKECRVVPDVDFLPGQWWLGEIPPKSFNRRLRKKCPETEKYLVLMRTIYGEKGFPFSIGFYRDTKSCFFRGVENGTTGF
jgi:hypothetical protein